GHVHHANDIEFHFAMHISFREREELRSLHTDIYALTINLYPTMNTGISKNTRNLAAYWLVERHVSDKSITEESRYSPFRPVSELICDKEFSGAQIFFERPHRANGDNPLNAEQLHRIDVGPIVDFAGKNAVSARMPGKKCNLLPFQRANYNRVRRIAEGCFDPNFAGVCQPLHGVKTTATNHPDFGLWLAA